MELIGKGVSNGIGMGTALVVSMILPKLKENAKDPAKETLKLENALANYRKKLQEKVESSKDDDEKAILSARMAMLVDPSLVDGVKDFIEKGKTAEWAVSEILYGFIKLFRSSKDELTIARISDLREFEYELVNMLMGIVAPKLEFDPNQKTIVVAQDVVPSYLVNADAQSVVGVVSKLGGYTSHSAIICRNKGIPAVFGVKLKHIETGDTLIVDGDGIVTINPTPKEIEAYQRKQDRLKEAKLELETFKDRPTKTLDEKDIKLYCNIGTPQEWQSVIDNGGEGIGLFRTEFLYMDRQTLPTEDELTEALSSVTKYGKEVTIRTLDIGGDKVIPCLPMPKEDNPFLGHRAIRFCLENEKIMISQLKAILRSSTLGNVKILLPHITKVEEILVVKKLLEEAMVECNVEGHSFDRNIKIGIMIETPASVWIADILAEHCDFFSIGTNDLTQYIMVADRGNDAVASYNSHYNLAVMRAIKRILLLARKNEFECSMCGEAAADELLLPFLLAYGLEKFSVSPSNVLATRRNIARWSIIHASNVARMIDHCHTTADVETILNRHKSNKKFKY